ncbi:thioredoxin [Hymenobacter busanensis]|uniref:Thioredoxin n=1 Tax=Hymenobacter busanensis TaxID=2607656 RepID=A0A7L4ZSD2_9BACT|nr:thioredoxin [Hymenobacter busanensis]KAA9327682.1 thioredoxin [Hymenobacter busanensis]QHJ05978.1 thioredoxin [Hymenobacter busanensis]
MTVPQPQPLLPAADAPVLLVLLPVASPGGEPLGATRALLAQLQHRLGGAVRVLKIDEALHPNVVRSFHATQLPACVLVRQGIELWRQTGLPDDEQTINHMLGLLAVPARPTEEPLPVVA